MTWLQFAIFVDPLLAHVFLDVVYEVVCTDIVSVLEQTNAVQWLYRWGGFFWISIGVF
jgi:hypothetical protein